MNQITPTDTAHSSLVGGSTAARRGYDLHADMHEHYKTARGLSRRVTAAALQELLRYETETGKLFWLPRSQEVCGDYTAWVRFQKVSEGREAFATPSSAGYLKGNLFGRTYVAHRVAWAVFHGEWPDQEIDHINHDKTDNRLVNLRVVSTQENAKNRKRPADNKSGMMGIVWDKVREKWRAYIYANKKRSTLGYFNCLAHAVRARRFAVKMHGYHENHGKVFEG